MTVEDSMTPKLLLVLSPERKHRLLKALHNGRFLIECASDFQGAKDLLGSERHFDLLILDAELGGGLWKDLLAWSRRLGTVSAAVVCARLGDHQLWSEVLQGGAYDLITEPLDAKEVARIVEGALNSRIPAAPSQLGPDRS
ncbi:MAG TPA: hypothetical protein VIC04_06935 [Terriglobia bacterium]|jgi:DNA-binding NtrC family response regulator